VSLPEEILKKVLKGEGMSRKSVDYARIVVIGLALVMAGCGTSGPYVHPAQVKAYMPEQKRNISIQPQLLDQPGPGVQASSRDYQVGPEDLLAIQVFGQDNLDREVRVNGQGTITLPLVGEISVAGLSPPKIEKRLEEAYGAEFLRHPQITVFVKEYRHQRVAVTGAVDKPGQYEMIGSRTLLEMLAVAGGLQDKPQGKAGDVVHIIRRRSASGPRLGQEGANGPFSEHSETIVIDLRRLLQEGATELNLPIRHGDIIHVPFAGNAYVLGGVRKPGSVAVKDRLTLTQAVAQAGGLDPVLGTKRVNILRLAENGAATTLSTDLGRVMAREEEDVALKDNDVVIVGESSVKKALFVFKELLPGAVSGAYRFAGN